MLGFPEAIVAVMNGFKTSAVWTNYFVKVGVSEAIGDRISSVESFASSKSSSPWGER